MQAMKLIGWLSVASTTTAIAAAATLEPGTSLSTAEGIIHHTTDIERDEAHDGRNLLSPSIETAVLDKHNFFRGAVGASCSGRNPTSAYMPPLEWDDELANFAQNHANKCTWGHSSSDDRSNIPGFNSAGENLYMSYGYNSLPSVSESRVVQAVVDWYREVSHYTYSTGSCTGMCGHYTQMVWAKSTTVGCAASACPVVVDQAGNKYYNAIYIACNYGPAGNVMGRKPYVAGYAGALCPNLGAIDGGLCLESPPLTDAPGLLGEEKCGALPDVFESEFTDVPTKSPTVSPTKLPTISPTVLPTTSPSSIPTVSPTTAPTSGDGVAPQFRIADTTAPTVSPTASPTVSPTASPEPEEDKCKGRNYWGCRRQRSFLVRYGIEADWPVCRWVNRSKGCVKMEHPCNHLRRYGCVRKRRYMRRFGRWARWRVCTWGGSPASCFARF